MKIEQEEKLLYMQTNKYFVIISLSVLPRMKKYLREKLYRNSKHILCSIYIYIFFRKSFLYEITWKNIVERGKPHVRVAHAYCMLDTYGYKQHTLRLCNTHCFPTTTAVARTRPSVTLHVYWLCFMWLGTFLQTTIKAHSTFSHIKLAIFLYF